MDGHEQELKQEQTTNKTQASTLDTDSFAKSLKSLCFFLGGTHVAGWVEEAERAAREGRIVKYE